VTKTYDVRCNFKYNYFDIFLGSGLNLGQITFGVKHEEQSTS